jgi:hypothetical protein
VKSASPVSSTTPDDPLISMGYGFGMAGSLLVFGRERFKIVHEHRADTQSHRAPPPCERWPGVCV